MKPESKRTTLYEKRLQVTLPHTIQKVVRMKYVMCIFINGKMWTIMRPS